MRGPWRRRGRLVSSRGTPFDEEWGDLYGPCTVPTRPWRKELVECHKKGQSANEERLLDEQVYYAVKK